MHGIKFNIELQSPPLQPVSYKHAVGMGTINLYQKSKNSFLINFWTKFCMMLILFHVNTLMPIYCKMPLSKGYKECYPDCLKISLVVACV